MHQRLFVISPIGPEGSPIRQEADEFLAMVNDAARDTYEVKRHDEQEEELSISKSLYKSLDVSPVIVAYLGREKNKWNPNVMFEIGYRIATRKAILLVSHEGDRLPFDIQDIRHVRLPAWSKLRLHATRSEKVEEIKKALGNLGRPNIKSAYPVVEILIDQTPQETEEERRRNCVFTMSSPAADYLFHRNVSLVGTPIHEALSSLESLVEKRQWDHFDREQNELLGKVVRGNPDITAKIPFIFKKDDDKVDDSLKGVAYLAMIVHHHQQETALLLRVLYYRVPARLLEDDQGFFYCDPNLLIDLPEAIQEVRETTNQTKGDSGKSV